MTTREDIIKMAQQAGWEMDDSCVLEPEVIWYISQETLERFCHMAQAAEREACARVCSEVAAECLHPMQRNAALHCGHAIRARGNK